MIRRHETFVGQRLEFQEYIFGANKLYQANCSTELDERDFQEAQIACESVELPSQSGYGELVTDHLREKLLGQQAVAATLDWSETHGFNQILSAYEPQTATARNFMAAMQIMNWAGRRVEREFQHVIHPANQKGREEQALEKSILLIPALMARGVAIRGIAAEDIGSGANQYDIVFSNSSMQYRGRGRSRRIQRSLQKTVAKFAINPMLS